MARAMAIGLLLLGCAAGTKTAPAPAKAGPENGAEAARLYADGARALEAQGADLEASFYFEAALAAGGDEIALLPDLIAAEVRAGRLREAARNLLRFEELAGDTPSSRELAQLLVRFAPAGEPEGPP